MHNILLTLTSTGVHKVNGSSEILNLRVSDTFIFDDGVPGHVLIEREFFNANNWSDVIV